MKGIPEEIKVILHRSVWLYLAVILVFAWSIDDRQATKERRRYLLGIFYNEELKNFKDGIIYFDYLIHQKPQEALNYFFLGYCYMQLDDDVRATRYFAQALKKDPNNATYQQ